MQLSLVPLFYQFAVFLASLFCEEKWFVLDRAGEPLFTNCWTLFAFTFWGHELDTSVHLQWTEHGYFCDTITGPVPDIWSKSILAFEYRFASC